MLELHNITKFFLQNTEPTLKSINLKVGEGEYCVILGSNGSGKSTLLKVISGEYPADSGVVILNGKNVTKMDRTEQKKKDDKVKGNKSVQETFAEKNHPK